MPGKQVKNIALQLGAAYQLLAKNDPMRLAGSTAFFTTFALPPILLILIQLLSLMFNRRNISRQLFSQLAEIVGRDSVHQLVTTLRGFRGLASNWPLAILLFIICSNNTVQGYPKFLEPIVDDQENGKEALPYGP